MLEHDCKQTLKSLLLFLFLSIRAFSVIMSPLDLNEEVYCKFSNFKYTLAPSKLDNEGAKWSRLAKCER